VSLLQTILLAVVGLGMTAAGQAPASSAAEALANARIVYAEQGPRTALPGFERALQLARDEGNANLEAVIIGQLGNVHKRLGDHPRALELLNRSLDMKRRLGDRLEEGKTLSNLGLLYWETGEYSRATDVLQGALAVAREVGNSQLEAAALNNLSLIYDELGDYGRSLAQYEQSLALHRSNRDASGEAATLGNIGGIFLLRGRFREALKYYEQAAALSERLGAKPSLSQDLGNIAHCRLGLGDTPGALEVLDRALALAREAGLQKEEADWHKIKGSALMRIGKYPLAAQEYAAALKIYELAGLKRELIEGLLAQGEFAMAVGDLASAERDQQRALLLARALPHPRGVVSALEALADVVQRRGYSDDARNAITQALSAARTNGLEAQMGSSLIRLARLEHERGNTVQGEAHAEEALQLAKKNSSPLLETQSRLALGDSAMDRGQTPVALEQYSLAEEIAASMQDVDLEWRSAFGRARALESQNRSEEAIAAYTRAIDLIESVRAAIREERFRSGYIQDKAEVYVALTRLLIRQQQISKAFETTERLRAYAYMKQVGDSVAVSPKQTELRARIQRLQRSLLEETAKDTGQQRSPAVALFSDDLAIAEREYAALLDDRDAPPLHPASGEMRRLLPVDVLRTRLQKGTALLAFVAGDDSLLTFVVRPDGIFGLVVPLRAEDLSAKVELVRDLLKRRTDQWRGPGGSLRQLLIAPVQQAGWLRGVRRLYIVPHRMLHYLPFGVLPAPDGRFLMDDFVIIHLPSAGQLAGGSSSARAQGSLLAIAPVRLGLPFARREAADAAGLFAGHSQALIGRQATESSFRRLAGQHRLLHLATHGHFNRRNPLLSGLELEADGTHDGRLEVHEILALRLDADLVTLSACDTALGSGHFDEIPAGDEFVGITRAFLAAGSRSVVATLWEVGDASTASIVRDFYRNLQQTDTATALTRALRRASRLGGERSRPYYWAAFVYVGD
jgi:CHAT domain-containing protein/Tfp pilus assembly protein PilF